METYLVKCTVCNIYTDLFTKGESYEITSNGLISDNGFKHSMFIKAYNTGTLLEKWLKWMSQKDYLEFTPMSPTMRRF
jgi:hypothetical protein